MAKKIIRVDSEHYILATSALADTRTSVLKEGDTFAIFNRYGDIQHVGLGEQGLYHEGTRFLSRLEFNFGSSNPFLLSSTVRKDNALFAVDLTNPDFQIDPSTFVPRGSLHISRAKLLWQSRCLERIRFTNYSLEPLTVSFTIHFEADFADIFEVRGEQRPGRGKTTASLLEDKSVSFQYLGLDQVTRTTQISCTPHPTKTTTSSMSFEITLESKEEQTFEINIACSVEKNPGHPISFSTARAQSAQALKSAGTRFCSIFTGNEQFNDWINRSHDDICMMTTELPEGPYPYAGVPWFSTVFGRDGIIAALECLWVNPCLARGVLAFLASTQAREIIPEQDAEPGKILHETRRGEMAALGEIPFARYYGSVDSTPLFIVLAGAYYERTGDKDFISSIWSHIQLGLEWIDRYGDRDQDGFVEYFRQTPEGLAQQGWKDSHDSVFHADGTIAEGPIALCEVQGYVYAAKVAASKLAYSLGHPDLADSLYRQAQNLSDQFNSRFWSDELGTYFLALDGKKQPCKVRTSNAGHTLFTDIATPERAERITQGLLTEEFYSGWGIRTLHSSELRYNPMAYHNGSIWPHDNTLIAFGMSRFGLHDGVQAILSGLFDMSIHVDLHRLPELICGFRRRPSEAPILYPVACSPQAWAAGAVFLLLQSCLGISFHGEEHEIRFTNSFLPEFLPSLQIKNLSVGRFSADLMLTRSGSDVAINVTRKDDPLNIVITK